MIQVEAIAKAYGGQSLFRDLSWRITTGERIGLVGPNGAGKTTLCRILAGLEAPDAGRVTRDRATTVGYLAQEVAAGHAGSGVPGGAPAHGAAGTPRGPAEARAEPAHGAAGRTVLGEALGGFTEVWALEREMEEVATALATAGEGSAESLTARYGDLQSRFEALGGYRLETEAKAILGGLGFRPAEFHRPLAELSGGWRMRAALARLLLLRPTLLLLDEPTNHLDLESLAWLEDYLGRYEGAVVVVSHDRYFLNRMVTSIADLGPDGLDLYSGSYDDFLVERDARKALREAQARNQAKRVAEIERFIERFRYKATKARQVQSRIKLLHRMERIEVGPEARQIRLSFPAPPRTGRRVVALRGVHKAYGAHVVYAGVDLEVERGERVALVGVNGAGKSTLLRILAGVLPFERGERALGTAVTVHYYAQHQLDALDPRLTVLEELERVAPDTGQTRLRTLLGAFLFSGDAVEKRVTVLSGGEKARVALAKMLVHPAPLLCLDEPTNHLDLASRDRVEAALAAFPGTIVFISHDRYFINRLASRVVEVAGGRLTSYPGDYDEYRAALDRATTPAAPLADAPAPPAPTPAAAASPAPRRRRPGRADPAVRELRRRVDEIERQIHALEDRLRELGKALGDPALYADGERVRAIATERKSAEEQVAWLMREWEDLSVALAEHE